MPNTLHSGLFTFLNHTIEVGVLAEKSTYKGELIEIGVDYLMLSRVDYGVVLPLNGITSIKVQVNQNE